VIALPSPGTTDGAGQIAIVQGVDSNVFQTGGQGEPLLRHPSAFTSLEGSLGVSTLGRVSGDSSSLRVFGRFVAYEPLGPHGSEWESKTGRAGLSHQTSTRLDRRTSLLTTLDGSIGSLQAARGADGTASEIDPVSSRRSTWNASGTVTFVTETSPLTTVRVLTGIDTSVTLSETFADGSTRAGLDYVIARSRASLVHRLDPRTFLEGALLVERMHTAYVLPATDPAVESAGIDGGDATASLGVSRLLGRQVTATGAAGVTFALPQFGERAAVLPLATAGLLYAETDWSLSTLTSFQYGLAQPRVGPGAAATGTLLLVGKPLPGHARDALDVVAEASAQRTTISVGPNDGSGVATFGGSITMRWGVGSGLGLLLGYDLRSSRFLGPADEVAQPWYVRHLGFVGLSYAFAGAGTVSALPTLARPSLSPFTP
jgi:hypothetical protein